MGNRAGRVIRIHTPTHVPPHRHASIHADAHPNTHTHIHMTLYTPVHTCPSPHTYTCALYPPLRPPGTHVPPPGTCVHTTHPSSPSPRPLPLATGPAPGAPCLHPPHTHVQAQLQAHHAADAEESPPKIVAASSVMGAAVAAAPGALLTCHAHVSYSHPMPRWRYRHHCDTAEAALALVWQC